jgi:hypothetical protein
MKKFKSLILAYILVAGFIAAPVMADTARLGADRLTFSPTRIVSKTADYTATSADSLINCDATAADVTVTLPTISSLTLGGTKSYKLVKTDSSINTCDFTPATGNTIGDETARVIVNQNGYIVISSGPGTDWSVDFESPYIVEDHEAGTSDLGTQAYAASIVFEGSTADAFETTFSVVDPTADGTLTIPALGAGTTQYTMVTSLATNIADAANSVTGTTNGVLFEGSTADGFETTLAAGDATADVTSTLPLATGTIALTTGVGSYRDYTLSTDNETLTVADCGKTYAQATDAKQYNLPATAAGCTFTFINAGAATNNDVEINPDAADQMFGTVTLAASVVAVAGAAGESVINTKATTVRGDSMTIVGDGADGWYIVGSTGIWAEETP